MNATRYVFKGPFNWGDGQVHGTVELFVDWDGVVHALGSQAARNRSRKSVEMSGLLLAKFTPAKVKS